MLSEHDLISEINKYNAKADLTPNECIRLAAFYTILNCQYPVETQMPMSMASGNNIENLIHVDGNSEFFTAIDGRNATEMWELMDELMEAISVVNPKLYESVMRKINS